MPKTNLFTILLNILGGAIRGYGLAVIFGLFFVTGFFLWISLFGGDFSGLQFIFKNIPELADGNISLRAESITDIYRQIPNTLKWILYTLGFGFSVAANFFEIKYLKIIKLRTGLVLLVILYVIIFLMAILGMSDLPAAAIIFFFILFLIFYAYGALIVVAGRLLTNSFKKSPQI